MIRRALTPVLVAVIVAGFTLAGCSRGLPDKKRQVVIVPDMEVQKKFKPQGATPLFEDGRMMRPLVSGTVARGTLKEDLVFYAGAERITPDTLFVSRAPVPFSRELLARGQEQFNVYCAPCHDRAGGGAGLVVKRGQLVPPPKLWEQRVIDHPDGMLFDIISNGIRSMPAYAHQMPAADRWAVVGYVRALQRAQTASLDDVPAAKRGEIR